MSAAERARLARAARAVLGDEAQPGSARAGTLRRTQQQKSLEPASLADLDSVPSWLPVETSERDRFFVTVGLANVAPSLARVIDGAILRKFAERAGSELVDWALRIGTRPDAPAAETAIDASQLGASGRAIMRTALPERLAARLGSGDPATSPLQTRWALDRAREAPPA